MEPTAWDYIGGAVWVFVGIFGLLGLSVGCAFFWRGFRS